MMKRHAIARNATATAIATMMNYAAMTKSMATTMTSAMTLKSIMDVTTTVSLRQLMNEANAI